MKKIIQLSLLIATLSGGAASARSYYTGTRLDSVTTATTDTRYLYSPADGLLRYAVTTTAGSAGRDKDTLSIAAYYYNALGLLERVEAYGIDALPRESGQKPPLVFSPVRRPAL